MNEILIQYKGVEIKQAELTVLQDVNLEVREGEFLYVMGKVGSGKSSLLKTLYAELKIAAGEAEVMGYNLMNLKHKQTPVLRRKIGIVFQDFQLLTDRCVYDNLYFVLRATGWKDKVSIENRINEVLQQVGMETKGYKYPNELSGGEQQRIVIARALLNSPEIILADEPTGNLDQETGHKIVELLYEISKEGTAVIMSTHNPAWMTEFSGTVLYIENHQITRNEKTTTI
ncbi:MAG: ATP-binding cassette domain-containing protein [Bacteroidaceae bacterium]|nr:ATP-binding cassette domain-containing protein [Bacteroidaceae bacterium]MBP9636857.1 ATP-binding cassette domain-containing protein [Bacteroidaceae bacterium]